MACGFTRIEQPARMAISCAQKTRARVRLVEQPPPLLHLSQLDVPESLACRRILRRYSCFLSNPHFSCTGGEYSVLFKKLLGKHKTSPMKSKPSFSYPFQFFVALVLFIPRPLRRTLRRLGSHLAPLALSDLLFPDCGLVMDRWRSKHLLPLRIYSDPSKKPQVYGETKVLNLSLISKNNLTPTTRAE